MDALKEKLERFLDQTVWRFIHWSCFTKEGVFIVWGLFLLILFGAAGSNHGPDID